MVDQRILLLLIINLPGGTQYLNQHPMGKKILLIINLPGGNQYLPKHPMGVMKSHKRNIFVANSY